MYPRLPKLVRISVLCIAIFIVTWVGCEFMLTNGVVSLLIANEYSEFRSPMFLAGAIENKVNGAPTGNIELSEYCDLSRFGIGKPWHVTLVRSTYNHHTGGNNVLMRLVNSAGGVAVVYAEGEFVTEDRVPSVMITEVLFADEWLNWTKQSEHLSDRDRIIKHIIGSKGLIRYGEGSMMRTTLLVVFGLAGTAAISRATLWRKYGED